MLANNYRIVQSEQGYSIYKVYYDTAGRLVSRDDAPVINAFSDTACGVTDWLEAISLAAEKPPLSLEQYRVLTQQSALPSEGAVEKE